MKFKPAVRTQRLLRLALMGPTGSGKTKSALLIARGLAGELGKVALIDTENHSASLYANDTAFDTLALTSFSPDRYIEAIKAAEEAGYDVLVIDSLSHAWAGKDGALEQVDKKAMASNSGSSFNAWRSITPMHNAMVDALVHCKLHLIVTMRTKTEYVQEKDDQGKTKIRKIGLQAVQRDGLEYEFDLVADMHEATMTVGKTRFSDYHGKVIAKPGERIGRELMAWLNSGEKRTTEQTTPPAVTDEPPAAPVVLSRRKITAAGKGLVGVYEVTGDESKGWTVTIRRGDVLANLTTGSLRCADLCLLGKMHDKEVEVEWVIGTDGVAVIRTVDAPWARPTAAVVEEPATAAEAPTEPERVVVADEPAAPEAAPEPKPKTRPRTKTIAEIVGPKT